MEKPKDILLQPKHIQEYINYLETVNACLQIVSNCDHKWTTLIKGKISCGKCGKHKEDIFPKQKQKPKPKR